jgi:hypothetical protein
MAKANKAQSRASKIENDEELAPAVADVADSDEGEGEDAAPAPVASAPKIDRSGAGQRRLYQNSQTIDSDVFKLGVARMRKFAGIREDDDVFDMLEHVHIFRTFDSSGKRQTMSPPVGGHFHAITVKEGKGGIPSIEVSPPMIMVKHKVRGKTVLKPTLLSEHRPSHADDHVHPVEYLRSEKLTLRKPNLEFAQVQAAVAAAVPSQVAGITG